MLLYSNLGGWFRALKINTCEGYHVHDLGSMTSECWLSCPLLWLDKILIWFLSLPCFIRITTRQGFFNLRLLIWNRFYHNLEGIHSWHNWGCCDERLSAGEKRARLVLRNHKGFNILTPLFNLATRYLEFDDLFFHIQIFKLNTYFKYVYLRPVLQGSMV